MENQGFIEWTPEQARYAIEIGQFFDAWGQARARVRKFAGSMGWKVVHGRRYLVRTLDRKGSQTSLGPASGETEALFEGFWSDKQEAQMRVRAVESRLAELARVMERRLARWSH